MKFTTYEVMQIAESHNQTLRRVKTPLKIQVTHMGPESRRRYTVALAEWVTNRVAQSLNHITAAEAVAYIQGLTHMAMRMGAINE